MICLLYSILPQANKWTILCPAIPCTGTCCIPLLWQPLPDTLQTILDVWHNSADFCMFLSLSPMIFPTKLTKLRGPESPALVQEWGAPREAPPAACSIYQADLHRLTLYYPYSLKLQAHRLNTFTTNFVYKMRLWIVAGSKLFSLQIKFVCVLHTWLKKSWYCKYRY